MLEVSGVGVKRVCGFDCVGLGQGCPKFFW